MIQLRQILNKLAVECGMTGYSILVLISMSKEYRQIIAQ